MKLKVGELVKVSHEMTEKYFQSVLDYVKELTVRIGEHSSLAMSNLIRRGE